MTKRKVICTFLYIKFLLHFAMRIDMTDESKPSVWQTICGTGTATDHRNNRVTLIWCIVWAATIIGATWIIKNVDAVSGAAAWIVALIPNVFALAALVSHLRYLRMTDELQRRIQIEGLAIGFGVGWIFAIGYQVAQAAGAPELPITTMILVMTAGWVFGTTRAARHYR